MIHTMRIVIGVTITDTDAGEADETMAEMEERVIQTLMPHLDDTLHTGHGNEKVQAIVEDWEVTS